MKITINKNFERKALEEAKSLTGENTYSKAVLKCIDMAKKNVQLQNEIARLKYIIDNSINQT